MPAPLPFEDVELTQTTALIPVGELTWTHPDDVDVDRAMLGYQLSGEDTWTNLPPEPIATYGVNPYSADVPVQEGITWRVVALSADGDVSA